MSEEERFKLENELLMTKSKTQMINLYLDKLDQLQEKENIIKEVREYIEKNCYKKMGGYGDNEDDDIEVCLFEDDIWELKEILDKGE
jgi:hypothetical protein